MHLAVGFELRWADCVVCTVGTMHRRAIITDVTSKKFLFNYLVDTVGIPATAKVRSGFNVLMKWCLEGEEVVRRDMKMKQKKDSACVGLGLGLGFRVTGKAGLCVALLGSARVGTHMHATILLGLEDLSEASY
ncbi:hypothetical protein PMIN02_007240 [Paraphaeosphaeria minitans]